MEHSSLPNTHDFITASGLQADAQSVAERAAKWAGLPPLWFAEYEANRSTSQQWSAPVEAGTSTSEPTAVERARWAKQDADARAAKIAAAKARAGELF